MLSQRPLGAGGLVAVVTGSGRGIGAAVARRLAADGLAVIVNYVSDEASGKATADLINQAGGRVELFKADVTDPEGVAALIAHASNALGPVDVLVNNAAGPIAPRLFSETSWQDVQDQLSTHLKASLLCVQAVLPSMLERGFGRIVNITSQAAYGVPPAKQAGYTIAKAALAALTRVVALEGGPHGITANSVAPGMVETDLTADIPDRMKMALAMQAPLRRLSTTNDVGDVVSFLVGPSGGSVTGQTIHLSGGQVMP